MLGLPGALGAAGLQGGMGLAGAASPNGLQSVDKAFDILAGTIGGLVLPGFVILGGMALTAANALKEWISANKLEIVNSWAEAIMAATKAAQEFADWWNQGGIKKNIAEAGDRAGKAVGAIDLFAAKDELNAANKAGAVLDDIIQRNNIRREAGHLGGLRPLAGLDEQNQRLAGLGLGRGEVIQKGAAAAGQEPGPGGNDIFKLMLAALDNSEKVLRDMQTSMGRPSLTDPVSKWKEVAQAISQSELENRKLAMQKENLDTTREILNIARQFIANQLMQGMPAVIPIRLG